MVLEEYAILERLFFEFWFDSPVTIFCTNIEAKRVIRADDARETILF